MLRLEYEGESMQTLAMAKHAGKFIITKIQGEKALSRRLSEIGMTRGKIITVLSGNQADSGLVIIFQGQKLALNASMATCIYVASVSDPPGNPDFFGQGQTSYSLPRSQNHRGQGRQTATDGYGSN